MAKILDYLEKTKQIQSISEICGKERRYRYKAILYTMKEDFNLISTDYQTTMTKLKRKEILADLIQREKFLELDPLFIQTFSRQCIEKGLAQTMLDRKTVSRLIDALEMEKRISKLALMIPNINGTTMMKTILKLPMVDEQDVQYQHFLCQIREKKSIKKAMTSSSLNLNPKKPSRSLPPPPYVPEMKSSSTKSFPIPSTSSLHENDFSHQYSIPRKRMTWSLMEDHLLMVTYIISKTQFKTISWSLIAECIEKKEKIQCQRRIDVFLRSPIYSQKLEDINRKYHLFLNRTHHEDSSSQSLTLDDMRQLLLKQLNPFRHFLTRSTTDK
jgi:hypothetical protein